ncbi:AAA family ATPase, partial [Mycobacteroides abscessus]
MSLPNEPRRRKRRSRNASASESAESIASSDHYPGLTSPEFRTAADALMRNGHHPLPLGRVATEGKDGRKIPWRRGFFGRDGVDATAEQVSAWPTYVEARIRDGDSGSLQIGVRMPVGGIGIDVDAYDGKRGLSTLAEHETRLGPLPPTWRVTARAFDSGSGIRLFRAPEGWEGKSALKSDDGGDGHIELIQRHLRLMVVPPSYHRTGARYKVYDERSGNEVLGGVIPPIADWPELPDAWLEALRRTPAKAGEATDEQVDWFAAEHTRSDHPWHLTEYIVPSVREADGSTRNAAFMALHEAARDARLGWCSWTEAVAAIDQAARERYAERGETFDPADFARSVSAAVYAANGESLPELQTRYVRRLADEEARRRAEVGVEDWLTGVRLSGAGATAPSRFRLVSARELGQPIKAMRWLVRGIWPERSAGVLGGDKKALKTWNLQAIALAVATGSALFDEYPVASSGSVLYLCGEGGQDTFANRHQVIAARYGITTDALLDVPLGAEFGVGMLTEREFTEAVKRHLDAVQPKLVILDPLYAYHPNDVEAQNLYARGPMLAGLRDLIGGEAALIVGDHFKKTAGGSLDLDNIAQAGVAQWADSWILQKHRTTPDPETGKFRLELSIGSRRGGGKHLEVDWTLKLDASDPDAVRWIGVDWDARPFDGKSASVQSQADKTVEHILQVITDNDFELTESGVVEQVGGRKEKTREALKQLKVNGWLAVKKCESNEGGRMVKRDRIGLGAIRNGLGGR